MARTLNGNLTGQAARTSQDVLPEPGDQDRRIVEMKKRLRALMDEQEFHDFYVKTSFNGDVLEKQLMEKLASILGTPEWFEQVKQVEF